MHKRILMVLAILMTTGPALAQVNALPSLPHLLVKGSADRDVVPDRFTVSVTLATTDLSPDRARETVQKNLAGIIASLKGSNAIADSIDATVFSVAPSYEYEDDKRVFKGTRATRQLDVTFPDADSTRQFLASLAASEEVVLDGIEPSYSGEEALRAELKAKAMQQTRDTASLLANSYGAQVRGLYSVSDVAPSFAYGIRAGQWTSAGDSAIKHLAGAPLTAAELDRITVTGGRITPESIQVGTINIAEHLYAIFLLAD